MLALRHGSERVAATTTSKPRSVSQLAKQRIGGIVTVPPRTKEDDNASSWSLAINTCTVVELYPHEPSDKPN